MGKKYEIFSTYPQKLHSLYENNYYFMDLLMNFRKDFFFSGKFRKFDFNREFLKSTTIRVIRYDDKRLILEEEKILV